MSKIKKAIERLKTKPRDLRYDELVTILTHLGYVESNKGKTSGSRVRFYHPQKGYVLDIHKPHERKHMIIGAVDDIVDYLIEKGEI